MRSKACMVLDRSNTRIVGSNPARGLDVCPHFSMLMLPCVDRGFAVGRPPIQGVLPEV
jgi:hypothetical protein